MPDAWGLPWQRGSWRSTCFACQLSIRCEWQVRFPCRSPAVKRRLLIVYDNFNHILRGWEWGQARLRPPVGIPVIAAKLERLEILKRSSIAVDPKGLRGGLHWQTVLTAPAPCHKPHAIVTTNLPGKHWIKALAAKGAIFLRHAGIIDVGKGGKS